MSYGDRKKIIESLEEKRKSKVITLITSDRYATIPAPGISAQIAADQVYKIIQHLKKISGDTTLPKIDLFIYSRGGDVNSAWPLVNNIRSYSKEFSVLIPLYALSSATLISLGANHIVMNKTASLSPIDPTVANAFNPRDNINQSLGISVEDVSSFFALAKDKESVGINSEDSTTEVFKILAEKVHPLALGNVKRSHTQIRLLARKLLSLTIQEELGNKRIDSIIDELTEGFYTHNHFIFREEAKKIGLDGIVVDSSDEEENLLWELYNDYEKEMQLKEFFDPNMFLGTDSEKVLETSPVLIESSYFSSALKFSQNLKRAMIPDPAFRLQAMMQFENNRVMINNFKENLLKFRAGVNQFHAQIAQALQQIPTSPLNSSLNNIMNSCNSVDNNINHLINSPTDLRMDELKKQIEFELKSLAWVDIEA